MRKIITGIAIALCAIVANAASVQWDMDYSYTPGTTDYAENYLVYFFDNAVTSRDNVIASIAAGNTTFVSSALGTAQLTDSEGYASEMNVGNYGNSVDVTGYLVIFNANTLADATKAYVTPAETGTTTPIGGASYLGFGDQTGTQAAGNWTAVPEPTSGLLILLGMAGLALKRKLA